MIPQVRFELDNARGAGFSQVHRIRKLLLHSRQIIVANAGLNLYSTILIFYSTILILNLGLNTPLLLPMSNQRISLILRILNTLPILTLDLFILNPLQLNVLFNLPLDLSNCQKRQALHLQWFFAINHLFNVHHTVFSTRKHRANFVLSARIGRLLPSLTFLWRAPFVELSEAVEPHASGVAVGYLTFPSYAVPVNLVLLRWLFAGYHADKYMGESIWSTYMFYFELSHDCVEKLDVLLISCRHSCKLRDLRLVWLEVGTGMTPTWPGDCVGI